MCTRRDATRARATRSLSLLSLASRSCTARINLCLCWPRPQSVLNLLPFVPFHAPHSLASLSPPSLFSTAMATGPKTNLHELHRKYALNSPAPARPAPATPLASGSKVPHPSFSSTSFLTRPILVQIQARKVNPTLRHALKRYRSVSPISAPRSISPSPSSEVALLLNTRLQQDQTCITRYSFARGQQQSFYSQHLCHGINALECFHLQHPRQAHIFWFSP